MEAQQHIHNQCDQSAQDWRCCAVESEIELSERLVGEQVWGYQKRSGVYSSDLEMSGWEEQVISDMSLLTWRSMLSALDGNTSPGLLGKMAVPLVS